MLIHMTIRTQQRIFLTGTLVFACLFGLSACGPNSVQPSDEVVLPTTSEPTHTNNAMGKQPATNLTPDTEVIPKNTAAPIQEINAGDPVNISCTETDPHPIGQSIAETYEVPYNQVMTWFCEGYSFENILIALVTSEAVDLPVDSLLEKTLEQEWEDIWEEIGFKDNP
jgi:hypothetical protein